MKVAHDTRDPNNAVRLRTAARERHASSPASTDDPDAVIDMSLSVMASPQHLVVILSRVQVDDRRQKVPHFNLGFSSPTSCHTLFFLRPRHQTLVLPGIPARRCISSSDFLRETDPTIGRRLIAGIGAWHVNMGPGQSREHAFTKHDSDGE